MRDALTPRFQPGGPLREGALYVVRPADEELPRALLRGEFCYVLAPRQIGKSSLQRRTKHLLEQQGVRCAYIDLTKMGSSKGNTDSDKWFFGLVQEVTSELDLEEQGSEFDAAAWWQRHEGVSPVHRFSRFLCDEVLGRVSQRVVLFIDEIDATLKLPFPRDDFFAALRAIYSGDAADGRLTFCLLGVAQPGDLIESETSTPFNIGRAIVLEDFTEAEAQALLSGLREAGGEPQALLGEVLAWTAGHPYMTQRICGHLVEQEGALRQASEKERVGAVVEEVFLRRGHGLDANLVYAEKWFQRENADPRTAQMLRLYRRLATGEAIAAEGQNTVQMALRLTGMAAERREGTEIWLRVRNRIFATVFDAAWIRLVESERLLAEPLARWREGGETDDLVLRGQALLEARDWARDREDVTIEEHKFLQAGLNLAQRQEVEKEQRQRAEDAGAAGRRQSRLLLVLLAVLLLGIGGTTWGIIRAKEGEKKADEAREAAVYSAQKARKATQQADEAREAAVRSAQEANRQRDEARKATQNATDSAQKAEEFRRQAVHEKSQAEEGRRLAQDRVAQSYFEQGRLLWLAQQPLRAMVYLAQAYKEGERSTALLFLLARAMAVADGHRVRMHEDGYFIGRGCSAFSPDGGRLVVGRQVFDPWSGKLLAMLKGASAGICPVISPDGQHVAAEFEQGQVRLWDLRTGAQQAILPGDQDWVSSIWFSPDSARVLTADDGGTARIWDVPSGQRRRTLGDGAHPAGAAAFSPDGQRVVTSGKDGKVRVWDARNGTLLMSVPGKEKVSNAIFSPDPEGTRLLGRTRAGLMVWDARSGKLLHSVDRAGIDFGRIGLVRPLSMFDPDASHMVSREKIIDLKAGRVDRTLEGFAGYIKSSGFDRSGGGIITGGSDRAARLWDATDGRLRLTLEGHSDRVQEAIISSAQLLAFTSDDRTWHLWDLMGAAFALRSGRNPAKFLAIGPTPWPIVATQPGQADGPILLTGPEGGLRLREHTGEVVSAAFSRDGTLVVTTSRDGTAWVWDARTGELITSLVGHREGLLSAAFSRDGRRVVTTSGEHTFRMMKVPSRDLGKVDSSGEYTARVWDAHTGTELSILKGHTDDVTSAVFTSDGARVLTTSEDDTVRLWDAASGVQVRTFEDCDKHSVSGGALSPEGTRVVVWGRSWRVACLRDTTDGRLMAHLRHQNDVRGAVFSPDGHYLLTFSNDATALLWNGRTGAPLATLEGHTEEVIGARFTPDGSLVLTSGQDGTLRVWDVATGKLLDTSEPGRELGILQVSADGATAYAAHIDEKEGTTWYYWDLALEHRSPEDVMALVRCHAPFVLRQGHLFSEDIKIEECRYDYTVKALPLMKETQLLARCQQQQRGVGPHGRLDEGVTVRECMETLR